jgi:hypothetical protein
MGGAPNQPSMSNMAFNPYAPGGMRSNPYGGFGGGMGGTNSSISGTSNAIGSTGGMRGFQGEIGEMVQPAVMPSNQPSQTYLQQPPSQTSPPMQNMMQRQPMQQFFNPFNPYGGMGGGFGGPQRGMGGPFGGGFQGGNPYGGFGNQFGGFQGGGMGGPFGGGFGSPFGGGMGSPFYGGGFGIPGGMRGFQGGFQPAVMPSNSMETTFDLKPEQEAQLRQQQQAFPSAMLGTPAEQQLYGQPAAFLGHAPQGSGQMRQLPPGMQSGIASLLRGFNYR